MKRVATLVTGLILVLALGAFAQGTSKATQTKSTMTPSATVMTASGTITKVDANQLVLTRKVRGKEKVTDFVLNDQTKKEGELKAGERATVRYRIENGKDIATMVKASTTMAKAGTTKK